MIMVICGCKACLLSLYNKLTFGLKVQWCVKAVAAYCAVSLIVMEILYFGVWCRPVQNYWIVPVDNSMFLVLAITWIDANINKYNALLPSTISSQMRYSISRLTSWCSAYRCRYYWNHNYLEPSKIIAISLLVTYWQSRKIILCGLFGLGGFVVSSLYLRCWSTIKVLLDSLRRLQQILLLYSTFCAKRDILVHSRSECGNPGSQHTTMLAAYPSHFQTALMEWLLHLKQPN